MGWKYKGGLLLLATVVCIWVMSAEVTQIIFEAYMHPFVITYLGASLMVVLLPISLLKEYIYSCLKQQDDTSRSTWFGNHEGFTKQTTDLAESPVKINGLQHREFEIELGNFILGKDNIKALSIEEGLPFVMQKIESAHALTYAVGMTAWEVAKSSLYMAPLWFCTEYLSNMALANTSVASTTILSSTSALFTLIFGSLLGQDRFTFTRVVAVLVTMTGVAMTTFGSTWAADDSLFFTRTTRHDIIGDTFGLLSAILYGLFTVLLKKVSGEQGEVDVQKIFGYIGLFTMVALWWLVWPLMAVGLEPKFSIPMSAKTNGVLVANGMLGSVLSDYLWALSVIWTSPLIATLGMSLTIPIAMLSDMMLHGRRYSAIYMIGSAQVFAGFMIANLSDECSKRFGLQINRG